MKRIILAFLFVVPAALGWATTDYYIVGDATPFSWQSGVSSMRKATKMKETTTPGIYVWTGLLKHGGDTSGNGFYICTELTGWSAIYPLEQMVISDTGESGYQTSSDKKWNPVNTDWMYYTITLNTNTQKVSWEAGEAFVADGYGYYNIKDISSLYCFSKIVNESNQNAKAKLTADIDYTACPMGFIGTSSNKYAGTFDGQEHIITLALESDAKISGLFAYINGATIKNLVVDGSITSSCNNIGGLGGQVNGSSTIKNIVVNTSINFTPASGDASIGGFFPYVDNSSSLTLTNCAFYGSINAGSTATGNAGLVSWNSGTINATNCLIAPENVTASEFKAYTRGNDPTTSNCYRVETDDARFASGELCYTMNGSTCYNPDWTQTIGTDSHPVPFATRGIVNKISSVGYTTQYIPSTDVTIPDGVEAYAGVINGEWLSLKEIESSISKNDAVILKGSEGYYSFTPTTGASSASSNDLKGSDGSVEGDGSSIYALANLGDPAVVGFYLVNDGVTVPAGKAYLNLSGSSVKGFTFLFDDDATSIEMVNGQSSMVNDNEIYNLAGQRLNKMQQGINIINGKKILK